MFYCGGVLKRELFEIPWFKAHGLKPVLTWLKPVLTWLKPVLTWLKPALTVGRPWSLIFNPRSEI